MRVDVKVPTLAGAVATRRFPLAFAAVAVASLALACSESQGPSGPGPSPFLVSSPVPDPSPTASRAVASLLAPAVVYVSLPPGAIPNGVTATIRDLQTGSSVTAAVVNGGFDPVALPALTGDTLAIAVQAVGGGSTSYQMVVAAATPPVVIRTSPPPNKRDVSLNSIVIIVFTEPLDSATVDTGSVKLWRGTTPVAGTVRFADAAHLRVEFHPDSLLVGNTDYRLLVSQAILDLNGLALDSAITVPFTTGITTPSGDLVFASVSAGDIHACGVTINGAAYCWGDNTTGELGDGTTASSLTPVAVAGGHTFRALSAGEASTCGVTTTGAAYCWGFGGNGELGHGTYSTSPVATPVPVSGGLTFTSVTVGGFGAGFACGLSTTGAAYCWGYNQAGEFGNGTTGGSATPVAAAGGLTLASIRAGGDHACGITRSGAAYCWGNNILGQVGDNTYGNSRLTPLAVLGGLTFAALDARDQTSCGITTAGALYCWGFILVATTTAHEICLVGLEQTRNPCSTVPAAVAGGPTFASLSLGFPVSCGVTPAGAAYCWGLAGLGNGTTGGSGTPVPVSGGLTFAGVSAGNGGFACGVTTGGEAYCWGENSYGQLGTGTTTSSTVPVKVAGQP